MTLAIGLSEEVLNLRAALAGSPVAFSYFDAGDHLRCWNPAYEDLNFRIRHMLRHGAYFPDLLAELVVLRQVVIPEGAEQDWVEERLRQRREGGTALRPLSDGRVHLVQERRDELGGTLGFWLDITGLVDNGALKVAGIGGVRVPFSLDDPGAQDLMRCRLQHMICNLELLRMSLSEDPELGLLNDALSAASSIGNMLDLLRRDHG